MKKEEIENYLKERTQSFNVETLSVESTDTNLKGICFESVIPFVGINGEQIKGSQGFFNRQSIAKFVAKYNKVVAKELLKKDSKRDYCNIFEIKGEFISLYIKAGEIEYINPITNEVEKLSQPKKKNGFLHFAKDLEIVEIGKGFKFVEDEILQSEQRRKDAINQARANLVLGF